MKRDTGFLSTAFFLVVLGWGVTWALQSLEQVAHPPSFALIDHHGNKARWLSPSNGDRLRLLLPDGEEDRLGGSSSAVFPKFENFGLVCQPLYLQFGDCLSISLSSDLPVAVVYESNPWGIVGCLVQFSPEDQTLELQRLYEDGLLETVKMVAKSEGQICCFSIRSPQVVEFLKWSREGDEVLTILNVQRG